MSRMHMIKVVGALVLVLAYICSNDQVEGSEGLSYGFYDKVCPQLEGIVRSGVQSMSLTDPTTPAALLRLMFHDCQGCDASILVDSESNNYKSEIRSSRNMGIRKREAVNLLKSVVEVQCPQRVSCADILILAAREAVFSSGGPRIDVPLGRRDSSNPTNSALADSSLPPSNVGVDDMLRLFEQKGLSLEESVAIIGAHTLGVTHCFNIESRLYDDPKSEHGRAFEMYLKLRCPQGSLTSNISVVLNEPTTLTFDNHYFINTINGRGVLTIDAEIPFDPRTVPFVQRFAADQDAFFQAFSSAFVKLSTSGVLTGSQGIIRRSCNALN
ncbi:peroxidase 29 isoform X2 [Lycium ferocissimum]|uniref:peroxidase 29 isoform X2 n=1 Tax=Lycium ferocissimum TaxID=112874 RepID=UPI002814FA34|nr:peroxidase 29 isoform X2 [Lycium ferocissimum]